MSPSGMSNSQMPMFEPRTARSSRALARRSASSTRLRSAISRSSSRGLRMASATGVMGTKAMTVLTETMAVASLIRPASR